MLINNITKQKTGGILRTNEQRQEHGDQRHAPREDPAHGHRPHHPLLPAGRGLRLGRPGRPAHARLRHGPAPRQPQHAGQRPVGREARLQLPGARALAQGQVSATARGRKKKKLTKKRVWLKD